MKEKITILCSGGVRRGGLLYFYSLFPLLRKKHRHVDFSVATSLDDCLKRDRNESILVVRYLTNNQKFADIDTTAVLTKLRDKYKNLAIFDDGARTAINFPQALPVVDSYFHSQLFRDFTHYKRPVPRGQLYSEYYSDMGIDDGQTYCSVPLTDRDLSKVHLAWNIGAGCYPRNNFLRRAGLVFAKLFSPDWISLFYNDPYTSDFPKNSGKYDVQARFSIQTVPTIAYHRKLVLKKVENEKNILTGFINPAAFREEIKNVKIVISPFGWGEVCFRDFEAVLNGALLLKPDMSHLKTWPDIYHPYETYVPFQWNAEDLIQKKEAYLSNIDERRKIAKRAFEAYMDELMILDDKVEEMAENILRN